MRTGLHSSNVFDPVAACRSQPIVEAIALEIVSLMLVQNGLVHVAATTAQGIYVSVVIYRDCSGSARSDGSTLGSGRSEGMNSSRLTGSPADNT